MNPHNPLDVIPACAGMTQFCANGLFVMKGIQP